MLQAKVDYSIERLQKGEKLALMMQPDFGYYLAFSGGKDSQCVLELAKMAGVRFKAVYNVTTNDPAENIRFIKQHYPEVMFDVPKTSYFKMIEKYGLPMMSRRWCCRMFKESKGAKCVMLTGVRAEESFKRSRQAEFMRKSKRKEVRGPRDLDKMSDNNFQCVGGRDKFTLLPIFNWTDADVWQFIYERGLPVNPCYESTNRVGCVYCPFSDKGKIEKHIKTHPKQYEVLQKHLQIYLDKKPDERPFPVAKDCLDWWITKQSIKTYKRKKNMPKQMYLIFD